MSRCVFDEAWRGRCKAMSLVSADRCEAHARLVCVSCAAPASQSCDYTGQFVCGAPLCHRCEHSPPDKSVGRGMFGMGGSHKTSVVADQEWRAFHADPVTPSETASKP